MYPHSQDVASLPLPQSVTGWPGGRTSSTTLACSSCREVPPSHSATKLWPRGNKAMAVYTYSWFKAPKGLKYQVRLRRDGGMVGDLPTHRGGLETEPDPSSATSWHRLDAEWPKWVSGATSKTSTMPPTRSATCQSPEPNDATFCNKRDFDCGEIWWVYELIGPL